jgi:hypothetical protein
VLNKKITENDLMQKKQNMFVKRKYVYSSVRAFSTNWPYITFSGLENFLLIVNVFDSKTFHRVQIGEDNEVLQICMTFITNTKDLFVVVKKDTKYEIHMLDLDLIH